MTEQPFEALLPRRVYFGAADKQHLANKPISGGTDLHQLEIGRRQKLAATLIQRADDVANAVKTLRAMDNTGNTEHAINHLQATLQDLTKSHGIFIDDVTEAIGRYRDRRENEQVLAESTAARRVTEYIPADGVLPAGILAAHPGAETIAAIATFPAGAIDLFAAPKPGPRA